MAVQKLRFEPEVVEQDLFDAYDAYEAHPGDDDYIDVDNGQCCCGEYHCKDEYSHWSKGY